MAIDLLRGRADASKRLRELRKAGDLSHTCAVNAEEIVRGLRENELSSARALFGGLRIIPLDSDQGWQAGQWRRRYSERGLTLSQADCLIAAAALTLGGRLATGNPKDLPMPGLSVEHWPVGEDWSEQRASAEPTGR